MDKLENWDKITDGIYKFFVANGWWYEIHVMYQVEDTDISTATVNLYLVGDWLHKLHYRYFSRECILKNKTIPECLKFAEKHYNDMDFDY